MKVRLCNAWQCTGWMRRTRDMQTIRISNDKVIYSDTMRIYECVVCGNRKPWLDKPLLNGTHAELHCIKTNEYSGMSMMSDPILYPPHPPEVVRVTSDRWGLDESGKRIYRWHKGRKAWIKV